MVEARADWHCTGRQAGAHDPNMAIRGIVVASLVLVAFVGTVAVHAHAEAAAPPVRSATPTPSAVPTATPTATATPVTSMFIWADVAVNAGPTFDRVTAMIGDVECVSANAGYYPESFGVTSAILQVPSSHERSGCGVPGAIVHFLVGGVPAKGTVPWQQGGFARVSVVMGPDWASYYGRYAWPATPSGSWFGVVAVINGTDCGKQGNPLQGEGPEWSYGIKVLPDELRPGCGRPGSVVRFELRAGDVLLARARETAIWQPAALQGVDLTFAPVPVLPATGAGRSSGSASRPHAAFALAAAGIARVAAGWRCRRRSGGGPLAHRRASSASGI